MPNPNGIPDNASLSDFNAVMQSLDHDTLRYILDNRSRFGPGDIDNLTLAQAIYWTSPDVQGWVLGSLWTRRRQEIENLLGRIGSGSIEVTREAMQAARERIIGPIRDMVRDKILHVVEESPLRIQADEHLTPQTLPYPINLVSFNLMALTPRELVEAGWLPMEYFRRYGGEAVDRFLDVIEDDFSRAAFTLAAQDMGDEAFHAGVEAARAPLLAACDLKLEIVRTFGLAYYHQSEESWIEGDQGTATEMLRLIGSDLTPQALLARAADIADPCPTETMDNLELAAHLLAFRLLARREGIFLLEPRVDVMDFNYAKLALMIPDAGEPENAARMLDLRKRALMDELRIKTAMFEDFCDGLRMGRLPSRTQWMMTMHLASCPVGKNPLP